jgi:hypothetical protein
MRFVLLAFCVLFASCGESEEDSSKSSTIEKRCDENFSVTSSKFVECRVIIGGEEWTDSVYESLRARVVENCVAEAEPGLGTASDDDWTRCKYALAVTPCDQICGVVDPPDPVECEGMSTSDDDDDDDDQPIPCATE